MGDDPRIEDLRSAGFSDTYRRQDSTRSPQAQPALQRRAELDALERFQAAIAAARRSDASTR